MQVKNWDGCVKLLNYGGDCFKFEDKYYMIIKGFCPQHDVDSVPCIELEHQALKYFNKDTEITPIKLTCHEN
jgi:hypothetical protein